jgi:hypothetical protein
VGGGSYRILGVPWLNWRGRCVLGQSLVLGDVVLLKLGDRVPADLRMIACEGLKVQRTYL